MFGKIVMYVCLALMAGLVPTMVVVWLREQGIQPMKRMIAAFRQLPLIAQIVILAFVANFIVYGSTKPGSDNGNNGTGDDQGMERGGREGEADAQSPSSSSRTHALSLIPRPSDTDEAIQGFTADEIAAGVVQTWIRTDEAWRFDLAPGATIIEPWRLRGAADDWASVDTTNLPYVVFADGRLQDDVRNPQVIYAPLQTALGVAPEANWPLIASSNAASRVWYRESDEGTVSVTWQDVLLARETNMPVSLQAVFDESGRFVYRYDLKNVKCKMENGEWDATALTNAFVGVVNNGHTLSAPMNTNVTSVGWYRLHPDDAETADRDGDGLATRDEVFFHNTDPSRPDTDCDGVPDGEEIARGLDPLDADTDHDGLVDGSDPDPLVETSLADLDGDGIPDAYENHWFGGTNAVDALTARDDTGFTLETKLMGGMNPTNAVGGLQVETEGELVGWKLWDAFAARAPQAGTDVVYERTVRVSRSNTLQQFYLSSEPGSAGAWRLFGMNLEVEWIDDGGEANVVVLDASPNRDSCRIPLSSNLVQSLTFRLRATGAILGCPTPVHLLAWAPGVSIEGGSAGISLDDGSLAYVFTKGAESRIELSIDRSRRPCHAALSADELDLSGLGSVVADADMCGFRYEGGRDGGFIRAEGPGIYDFPTFEVGASGARAPQAVQALRAPRAPVPGGRRLIVLEPGIGWEGEHSSLGDGCGDWLAWDEGFYEIVDAYPLDSACLRRGWLRSSGGGRSCTCEGRVSSGIGDEHSWLESSCRTEDGRAFGSLKVGGVPVWSATVEHVWENWFCFDRILEGDGDCGDCGGCESGNCNALEGGKMGSLKFRIPLGVPRKDQVSGFVFFNTDEPIHITPAVFELKVRGDAVVNVTTNGVDRTVVCGDARGRTQEITALTGGRDGVRVRITTTSTGVHEHTWEIEHVGGDLNTVRFHKISRQNNTMEDWTAAYVYDASMACWQWHKTDNVSRVREELTVDDRLNEAEGTYTEYRDHFTADGTWLGSTEQRRERIGRGEAAVLRETYYRECSPGHDVARFADYWTDPEYRSRNGRLRFMSGDDRPWEYHTWTENGYERLRVTQRDGSPVPDVFPEVDGEGVLSSLAGVSNALVTVYGYAPLEGDAAHPDENGCVRSEARYVVRDGVATCIGRTWHRFTHVTVSGYAAVKEETWRAASANAEWNDPGNAYSFVATFSESGEEVVPLTLRGKIAEQLDEDGVHSVTVASEQNGRAIMSTRKSFNGVVFPEYEVVEYDATHGVELRRATCLAVDDAVIDETTSAYDDQNRLRHRAWLDGTSQTNAFSCCRLLWSRDRQGRRTLRSAVTGEDHLYWAEEEAWLGDARLRGESDGTNGPYRVTQHFRDAFGRETNRVAYAASAEGHAVDWTVSAEAERTEDRTDYYSLWGDEALHMDARGKSTRTQVWHGDEADETTEQSWWDGHDLTETRVNVRNGARTVRKAWSDKTTETMSWTDYDADGCRIEIEVTTSSDYGVVTNRVSCEDFLGRRISLETPEGTTTYTYADTSRRQTGSVRTAGDVSTATSVVYNDRGEEVGTVENGICTRQDMTYEQDGGGWWKVTRQTIFADDVTNAVVEMREQLTGRGADVRKRNVQISADGVVQDTVVVANADGTETTTVSNALAGVVVTTNLYGLALSRTTADGTRLYAYDAFGRRIGEKWMIGDEERPKQNIGYTLAGDVAFVRAYTNATDGVTESYVSDALGNRTSVTDTVGGQTTTAYDALGHETEIGGTATYGVRYGYDTQGRRTSLATSRDGTTWDVTGWTYDAGTGRKLAKRYADGREVAYDYTADGLVERITQPSGIWRAYGYDAQRRRVAMTSSDGSADAGFAYDVWGRKIAESNDVFIASYLLAQNGRATNEVLAAAGTSHVFVRTLDDFGRVAGRGFTDGTFQVISYTPENRMAAVATPDVSVTYAYGADGNEAGYTVAVAGGATIQRVVVRDPYRGTVTAISNFVNGSCIRAQSFAYDALERLVTRDGDSFAYNARSELTDHTSASAASSYAYDGIGNFTAVTRNGAESAFAANAVNQYAGLVYTQDGELVGYGDAAYAYDAAGRLTSVTTGGVCAATYAYDPQDRRVRKTTPEATHLYFYDGWNLVREEIVTAAGTETVEYFWGRDLSGMLDGAGGVGGLVYLKRGGNVYIPLYDGNGNIIVYLDVNGSTVAEYVYDAFGACVSATGVLAESFRFRYSTKYVDLESGLVYYGYRYYLPSLGRWLNRDPIEEQGGLNLYSFCANNAVCSFDELGLIIGDREYWKTEGENYFISKQCPWSAKFLDHSLQDHPADLTMYMSHPFTALVKGSNEYKKTLKEIVGKQIWRYGKYEKALIGMNFTSKDLATTIAHASMEYSGEICKDIWGGVEIDLTVKVYDTYDFHYEWFNPFTQPRLLGGNTLACTSQLLGAIVPYTWSVNFTEHGESF